MDFQEFINMAYLFNKMSFENKIVYLKEHKDKLELHNDYNWWWIEAKNKIIEEFLKEREIVFEIKREWDTHDIWCLLKIIGV